MLKIFSQITHHLKEYLILSAPFLLSLLLIFSNTSHKSHLISKIAVEVAGISKSITGVIPNLYNLRAENKELRKTNIILLN
ncbi:hypothetical protein JGI2_01374 [Candidatus Kryptobacter tengchongensis]|nr:hypothetical protein JGI2_01374 [Candidatus Kryptobacter tengchongensis]